MIQHYIRDVPDFPTKGILFEDITPLLQSPAGLKEQSPAGLKEVVAGLANTVLNTERRIRSRGFIFGTALAHHLGKGFIPIRKPGKLPCKTASESYELEDGSERLEIHLDACKPNQGGLVVDDLLPTGGTAEAALKLVRRVGGKPVACAFVIELGFLNGKKRLGDIPVHTLMTV